MALAEFVAVYESQLRASGLPEALYPRLFEKLTNGVFDMGAVVQFCFDDEENELRTKWSVLTSCHVAAESDVFLLDHAWSFDTLENAVRQLNDCLLYTSPSPRD